MAWQVRQTTATAVGFLVASLIPAVLFAVFTPMTGTLDLRSALGTFRVTYPFSAIATILFGAPAFLALRRFGLIKWWSTLGVGFCLGALVAVVMRLPNQVDVHDLLTFAPMAAASAFVFWLVWRLGNESS